MRKRLQDRRQVLLLAGYGSLHWAIFMILEPVHPCFSDESHLAMFLRTSVIEFADERGSAERVYTYRLLGPTVR